MLQHPPASLRVAAERADARANRARLIAAARELFRERGVDAEMKEIAERAGLGVGTIYRNFPTKDDLLFALVMEMVADVLAVVAGAARIPDSVAGLRHLLRHGFDVSERHGDLMMVIMGGKMPPACKQELEPLNGLIEGMIQTGIDRGAFRADIDPGVVAAQIHAAFLPWSYQELRRTRTPDQITDAYMKLILRGIAATAALSPGPSPTA